MLKKILLLSLTFNSFGMATTSPEFLPEGIAVKLTICCSSQSTYNSQSNTQENTLWQAAKNTLGHAATSLFLKEELQKSQSELITQAKKTSVNYLDKLAKTPPCLSKEELQGTILDSITPTTYYKIDNPPDIKGLIVDMTIGTEKLRCQVSQYTLSYGFSLLENPLTVGGGALAYWLLPTPLTLLGTTGFCAVVAANMYNHGQLTALINESTPNNTRAMRLANALGVGASFSHYIGNKLLAPLYSGNGKAIIYQGQLPNQNVPGLYLSYKLVFNIVGTL